MHLNRHFAVNEVQGVLRDFLWVRLYVLAPIFVMINLVKIHTV